MKISLRRRIALMVQDGAFSLKIDYVSIFWEILNLKGHPNRITGSRVMAILLIGLILPNGEVSAVEGLRSTGLPRLVLRKRGSSSLTPIAYKASSAHISAPLNC